MKSCLLSFVFLLLIFINCKSQNVDKSPAKTRSKQGCLFISDSFNNINSAMAEIDNTSFTFYDFYYPKSNIILETSFYACEKKDGHLSSSLLIIKTKTQNYIFKNVPKKSWLILRKAKSVDKYLEEDIKNKYENILTEMPN